MSPDFIRDAIDPIYRDLFGAEGYKDLSVRYGFDHADEPAMFIDAVLTSELTDLVIDKIMALEKRVHDRVRPFAGEHFPYVFTRFDEEVTPEDYRPIRVRRRRIA